MIHYASKLQRLIEWEATLDFFDYELKKDKNGFQIKDEVHNFEKSKRIGYTKFAEQQYIFNKKAIQSFSDESITIDRVIETLNPNEIIKVVGKGKRKRYRVEFIKELIELFSDINFEDHLIELEYLAKEWNLTIEDLNNKYIVDEVTFFDISKFTFIFKLIAKIFIKYIKLNPKINDRDILGLGEFWLLEDSFYKLMDNFLERNKSMSIINLLTVDLNNPTIDFLYTPLIREKNRIGVYTFLFSNSNILRNIIQHSYISKNKTVSNNDGRDGLSKKVAESFIANGNFSVHDGVEYSFKGQDAEIDVLAISKEYAYIIECKNSLYPTNSFETRTSIDNLSLAKKQLNFHLELFRDDAFIKYIESKLEENIPRKIKTIIIMGNRLFTGNATFGHPIRPYFELDNILNGGYINVEFAKYRIWNKEIFEEIDLLNYLEYDTSFVKFYYESVEELELVIKLESGNLSFISYALNQLEIFRNIRNTYDEVILDEEQHKQFVSLL